MNTWTSLSNEIEAAVAQAAPSIVQVHGHRRVTAGLVIADNLIVTPAATDDDKVAVLTADDQTAEGVVLGRIGNMGLTVVRVDGLNRPALVAAQEPKPGQLAVAVGRTWSGGVMATLAPIAVVGGPLRTGRTGAIDRVIRIQQSPHGALNGGALINAAGQALGIITSLAIRGTTVVIPASIAWAAATKAASEGGVKQGFIGVSSMPVPLPEQQRARTIADVGSADQPRRGEQSCRTGRTAGRRRDRRLWRRGGRRSRVARHPTARQQGRRGGADHRDSRHQRCRCNRHRQRASKIKG